MAPEIIRAEPYIQAVDIWAIGVMAYELLFDECPFRGVDAIQVYNEIKHKLKREETIFTGKTLSNEARHFIQGCLKKDPRDRPSAEKLLKHPWIVQVHRSKIFQQTITMEYMTDVYLNLYTFKRCSFLHSSVLSILVEHNPDPEERGKITEIFHHLDTD